MAMIMMMVMICDDADGDEVRHVYLVCEHDPTGFRSKKKQAQHHDCMHMIREPPPPPW